MHVLVNKRKNRSVLWRRIFKNSTLPLILTSMEQNVGCFKPQFFWTLDVIHFTFISCILCIVVTVEIQFLMPHFSVTFKMTRHIKVHVALKKCVFI